MTTSAAFTQEDLGRLEKLKLQQETGWRSWAVPIASGIFALATIGLSALTFVTTVRASDKDHTLACANLATAKSRITSEITADLARMPIGQPRTDYAFAVIMGLPPELARGLADVLAARSGAADDYNLGSRIQTAKDNNPAAFKRADTDCPNSKDVL